MPPRKAGSGKKGKPRVSAYSVYVRAKLEELKFEHSEMEHRERFKLAALSWAKAPQNPKNR